jgi:hypothetical protein
MRLTPVSRPQWIKALLLAVLLAAFFNLPYLLGHNLAQPGTVYTGLLINVEDGSYLGDIEQGRQGKWTYTNLFTPETHEPVFIQGFYLALGHLGRLLGLSTVATWHLGRFLANLIFFLTLFAFVAFFFANSLQRYVAFALIVLGGGFDWREFPLWLERPNTLEAVPVDLFMPEAHPFFSALTYPHFVAGITLIMLALWLAFGALTTAGGRRWWLALAAGVGNLLLAVVYPYLLLIPAGVLGVYYLLLVWPERRLRWPEAGALVVVFAVPLPLMLYYVSVLSSNPVMQQWNAQAVTLSPTPLHYFLAYLPYLVPALLTLRLFKRSHVLRQEAFIFLWVWVAVTVVLLYTPINPQRRFVEGFQIPLAILATIGLFEWVLPGLGQTRLFRALALRPRYSAAGLQKLAVVLFIATSSLIHFFIYMATVLSLVSAQAYPLFRPQAEIEAMLWLGQQTTDREVVLADYWTGSYLPSIAGSRVFVGHLYETVRFEERRELARQFFDERTTDEWRLALLGEYQVAYLFWGPAERASGDFDPAETNYLIPVFENDEATVYRVQRP